MSLTHALLLSVSATVCIFPALEIALTKHGAKEASEPLGSQTSVQNLADLPSPMITDSEELRH
jgi:hypothetical protein